MVGHIEETVLHERFEGYSVSGKWLRHSEVHSGTCRGCGQGHGRRWYWYRLLHRLLYWLLNWLLCWLSGGAHLELGSLSSGLFFFFAARLFFAFVCLVFATAGSDYP